MDPAQRLEILLAEYKACNDGYNTRDNMAFHEFNVIAVLISGLIVVIYYGEKVFLDFSGNKIFFFGFGYVGFLAMLALSIDLASTYSSKQAIRKRMENIEDEINHMGNEREIIKLWHDVIKERDNRHFIEEYKSRYLTIPNTSFILIGIWLLYIMYNLKEHPFTLMLFAILIAVTFAALKKTRPSRSVEAQ